MDMTTIVNHTSQHDFVMADAAAARTSSKLSNVAGSDGDDDDDDEPPLLVALDEEVARGDSRSNQPGPEDDAVESRGAKSTLEDAIDPLPPCPVTILSGFLGSGKTTLIQHILRSPNHGKRIAVIENEFGDGLDIESIIARDGSDNNASLQELIELPNGCVCCTVKDSLVECLENLIDKRKDLDYILIECSGMANPGPIASLFWLDDALESRLRLDGIVTMVDAKNILEQLRETEEAAQQIAFADRVLINKTDLVSSTDPVRAAIQGLHPTASMLETTYSTVPDLEWILDGNFYSHDRLEELERIAAAATTSAPNEDALANAHSHSHEHSHSHSQENSENCDFCLLTHHRHTSGISTVALVERRSIDATRLHQWLAAILWPQQDSRSTNETLGIEGIQGPQNAADPSVRGSQHGMQQIFRIKGIVSVRHAGNDDTPCDDELSLEFVDPISGLDRRRYIVQAVHDLWDVRPASDCLNWSIEEERVCKLVIIGRFQEEELRSSFRACFD